MPVLVLILCFIGNYFIYRDTGDNLEINYTQDFFETQSSEIFYEDRDYDSQFYGLYLPTYLTDDEVLDCIISANLSYQSMDEFIPGLSFCPLLNFVLEGDSTVNVLLMIFKIGDSYAFGLIDASMLNDMFSNLRLYWCSDVIDLNGLILPKGWINLYYHDFNFNILQAFTPSNFNNFYVYYGDSILESQLDILYPLFTCDPTAYYKPYNYNGYFQFEIIEKDIKSYGSFFDISMINTDNTFKKFQLPFLRNAFDSVFNILEFESSYVSSFVLTSFTWIIQLLLLHVVVDTLAFIFKMYHKLMDKVV